MTYKKFYKTWNKKDGEYYLSIEFAQKYMARKYISLELVTLVCFFDIIKPADKQRLFNKFHLVNRELLDELFTFLMPKSSRQYSLTNREKEELQKILDKFFNYRVWWLSKIERDYKTSLF